jgi:cell division protein FtsQ
VRKLKKAEVIISNYSSPFIKPEMVNKLLIENNRQPSSIEKLELDLNKIEKSINSNPMVEKSEVFLSVDGVLVAVVKQKNPIARVFSDTGSYYFDYHGSIMPLSENFTARVPIVSGEINQKNVGELNKLLQFIYDDDFLKMNIIGIQILPNGEIKMVTRTFEYEIDFGTTHRFKQKFKNYKAFYQKAITDTLIYKYKKINLKFEQQVVCTK